MNPEKKCHPGTAAVLSFVFNGLGQLYNGQILKGIVMMLISAVGMLTLIVGAVLIAFWLLGKFVFDGEIVLGSSLFVAGLVVTCIVGIYSIIDAYKVAMHDIQ
jgi:TM2 domain-containing membrane protein YozV